MINSVAFQTKARTVDHLGREQIADCPTAISELWKNAYDAYARTASLHIFKGDVPVAALLDDGHGMSREEFVNNWLVVGTASKISNKNTVEDDRNGLLPRIKQGQKGIGRLSCANLGPLLLLVSKRKNNDFVAALVDWRIFENPFLNLSDILLPVIEFKAKDELFNQLPDLFDSLMSNIWGSRDDKVRSKRITDAWKSYDQLRSNDPDLKSETPASELIASTIIASAFEAKHLEQWDVWSGRSEHGTALLISQITYDLNIYVTDDVADAAARGTKEKLFETLSCFVNPFINEKDAGTVPWKPDFTYEVKAWTDEVPKLIVGSAKQFSKTDTDSMEHRIEGIINLKGEFVGRIKAFGEWQEGQYRVPPPKDLKIPITAKTKVGPVEVYIAALEFQKSNTTHEDGEFANYKELAEKYSGLMIFRDGLRVMPYGRTDNDFFEIDDRRSRSAGREFWNNRQMFGGLSIRQANNPNLKDKAGREGILDNVAAKTFKALIANVLMRAARDYFGKDADLRKAILPEIQAANLEQRAADERNKLARKNRRLFSKRLKSHLKELPNFIDELENYLKTIELNSIEEVYTAQDKHVELIEAAVEFKLPGAPKKLGSLESSVSQYKNMYSSLKQAITDLDHYITEAKATLQPAKPEEMLEKEMQRGAAQIHRQIQKWKKAIDSLQKSEFARIRDLIDDRNKVFHHEMMPLVERVKKGDIQIDSATDILYEFKARVIEENENIFPPYIYALESLQESIDLEYLATFATDEVSKLETELERLNSLAQLGIAVEIIGHELESYDDIIGSGISRLPEELTDSPAVKDIKLGYDGLTDQLRYLSPLKLSGQRIQRWITGEEIFNYVYEFFDLNLQKADIRFEATGQFKAIRVFDQPSRLFPVFINLVNNSRYWLGLSDNKQRLILLDVLGKEVVVSDNGPGVDEDHITSLFSLFFTTKLRGGRGIGLYLCRANLAAGGHKIRYGTSDKTLPLNGANFLIEFRGAEFSDK